jgi:hypothetical protein
MLDWWLGYGAHQVADKYHRSRTHLKALDFLEKLGPKACLLAWLPIVGDPLCAVAGWLRLPFWPCVAPKTPRCRPVPPRGLRVCAATTSPVSAPAGWRPCRV